MLDRPLTLVLDTAANVVRRLGLFRFVRRLLPRRSQAWIESHRSRGPLVPPDLGRWYGTALDLLVSRRAGDALGDYLEFGVYRGDSMGYMFEALNERRLQDVRLFGFDSFEGLPRVDDPEDSALPWVAGQFASPERVARERLERRQVDMSRVFLVKGWYSDTLRPEVAIQHGIVKASVIMVDCDLYTSAKEALDFCAPLIKDDVVIVFDDWDGGAALAERSLGEKKAFDEFLIENPTLHAEEMGSYYHTEYDADIELAPVAKVFLVSRS